MEDHLQFFNRDVLFEFHLKFWNTACIGVQIVYYKVDRLLTGLTAKKKEQLLHGIQIKHLYHHY